ncbi:MAG: hypothetical protein WAO76_05430, partial [Georgfuchsia sp.]
VAKPWQKGLVGLLGVVVILGWLWLLVGRTLFMDQEVKRLCAIDGGVKVYETVKLSPEKYNKLLDKFGRLWIPRKKDAKPTDDFYSEEETYYYREGNPQMSRELYRIVRRADGKVLGELVFYGRGGGDMPGPWHGSSFTCPAHGSIPPFESSIFLKGE